jgi:hypothetical protein
MNATPNERSLIARIAAHERWANVIDRTAATAPARSGLRAKFAAELDPDGQLTDAELEHRVDQRLHAHMLRMSLAAKRARERNRKILEVGDQ